MNSGDHLGPYRVLDKLGEGGMGEVYRARDTKLGRDVAIKVLPALFASDPDRLMRFEREAKTLASLNHPHIGQIYGLEQAGNESALVMELVEGEDLAQRLARGAMPLDEALPIASQIAEALEAAHEAGIIHRDLKPANIKVRPDGTVKVLDFGLSKASGAGRAGGDEVLDSPTFTSPAVTMQGVILGTAAYMSPEQARGMPVDHRADLWAFGCVLFEMLTGTRPFPGDTVTDILAGVVKEEPPWDALPAETPAAIQRLLRRCLQKDRRKRLAAAADARLEIEDALSATPIPLTRTTPPPARRSPLALAVGLAAAIAAVAGAYLLGTRTATDAPTAPMTRFVIPAPPGTQIVATHREVALSPDGQQVAFIARGATDQHIYVRRLDELTPRQIPGTDGARDLTFSPDGRWLAFHAGNRIRKVSLAGGPPEILSDATHAHGLAWHPSEDAIYFAPHESSAIWKVAANGTAAAVQVTTLETERGEVGHEWPVISADGRTLVFTANATAVEFDGASFLTLATNLRHTVRAGGGAFAFTDAGELLFVRRRAAMAAEYRDGQLVAPGPLDSTASIAASNDGVVALSATGTFAYVPSPDLARRSLVWISPDGRVSDAGFGQREFSSVSLSSDGQRAAIGIGDGPDAALYLAGADGGTLTLLTRPSARTTVWSPDAKWIAGAVWLPNASRAHLARVAADAGGRWETLAASDGFIGAWTPDGRGILVTLPDPLTGSRSIALLALDSTPPGVSGILNGPEGRWVQFPSLSPDGRWLAYSSNETGRAEVYVQGYRTSSARVQVSRDGGSRPVWTQSGNAIYFVAGTTMLRSLVTKEPDLRVSAPEVIVTDPLLVEDGAGLKPFDVTPDGRVLAIREDGSIRSDHIVVVQNWLSQARARLR